MTSVCYAKTEVIVTPESVITTASQSLQEGDYVDFLVINNPCAKIKQGATVKGLVTYIEENGFWGKYAKITIEQLFTLDKNNNIIKLDGCIFDQGSSHQHLLEIPYLNLRGGEVVMKPDKNFYKLYLKE